MAAQRVVLVDTYALSQRLAAGFIESGIEPIRVQSTTEAPRLYAGKPDPNPYLANFMHEGDVAATAAALEPFEPLAVIAGGELGVELADALSEQLARSLPIPTNGTALSEARRNKHTMIERIKASGLRGAEQLLVRDEEQLRAWHERLGGRAILKPLRSAANDGVFWCDTPEQSVLAYRALAGRENIFSEPGDGVVAQEYLVGAEYLLNTVSRDGNHHVCDIWKTHRISANGKSDLVVACQLLPRGGEAQEAVVDYGLRVLDALGIAHGPAHVEIKLTPQGPCLVEVGARISGLDLPGYTRRATGESQIDWTVDAYANPERFLKRYQEPYVLSRSVAWAGMVSPVGGVLRGYRGIEQIEALESFRELHMTVRPGGLVTPTIDDSSYPLAVSLEHEVDEILLRDLGTLRWLDGLAFYDVADSAQAAVGS